MKIASSDPVLDRVQEHIEQSFQAVTRNPLIDGVLIENVSLVSASTNIIEHKLSREVIGYIIVSKSSDSNVWDDLKAQTKKKLFLNLETDVDTTVSLWIF